jgi:hypothetical protein
VHDREARGVKGYAAITVRRTVYRVDDHGERAPSRNTGLFTHDPESGAPQDASRNVVGRNVKVILRRAITGQTSSAMVVHRFTDLLRARAKGCQKRVIHAATVLVEGGNLMVNGRN